MFGFLGAYAGARVVRGHARRVVSSGAGSGSSLGVEPVPMPVPKPPVPAGEPLWCDDPSCLSPCKLTVFTVDGRCMGTYCERHARVAQRFLGNGSFVHSAD